MHHQFSSIDGLLWMSRQRDPDQALVLFGDRAGDALRGTRVSAALRIDENPRQAVLALAQHVGIEAA